MNTEEQKVTLQVAVKAFIVNDEGKVLIVEKNRTSRPDYPAKWDIPGGRIEPGTDLITNLEREVYEETGLKIFGTPRFIYAQDIIRETFHIVRLTYMVQATGDVKLSPEHVSYIYATFEEVSAMDGLDECIREVLDNADLSIAN